MDNPIIHALPEDERPREKAIRHGIKSLSDAELLAILLRVGIKGQNAIQLGAALLEKYRGLDGLSRASIDELKNEKGLGLAKAAQIMAALDIGRRVSTKRMREQQITGASDVYDLLSSELNSMRQECLKVLILDSRHRLIKIEEISKGTLNECIAHPRDIFLPVIVLNAYAFIVAHNHPSGDPSPSEADQRLTQRLIQASETLQVRFIDHIIIGKATHTDQGWYSFREHGKI